MSEAAQSLEALLDGIQIQTPVGGRTPLPGRAAVPGPQWPSGVSKGIAKVSYTHDSMIDLILANPTISQNQLAAHYGYSATWVSQIISSDAFQARLAERASSLIDPTIRATVEDRFRGLVYRSLEILSEKLEKPSHQIPDNLALRTLELSSRALGYGARDQTPPTAPVEMHVHLENLGQNLTQLLHRRKAEATALDGEIES